MPSKNQVTGTESATAQKARTMGLKTPEDYVKKVREVVPDFEYETTFGTVYLPGYLPVAQFLAGENMTEQQMFQQMILGQADEASQEIVNLLPIETIEAVQGAFMDLMKTWFLNQGIDLDKQMGESQASSD